MERMLKFILLLFLCVTGIVCVIGGFGVPLPLVKYKEISAYGLPAGFGFLLIAVLFARFWKVKSQKTVKTEITKSHNGTTRKTTETTIMTSLMKPPF